MKFDFKPAAGSRIGTRAGRLKGIVLTLVLAGVIPQVSPAYDHPQPASGPFATPLSDAAIDDAASAEWVEGMPAAGRPVADPVRLRQVMWTLGTAPGTAGYKYGASSQAGKRHLRIGFRTEVTVGSLLVSGGEIVDVLRPGVPYPGNVADDSQWIPTQRIVKGQISSLPGGSDGYVLWVLPAVIKTRALRFTHTAVSTDADYAGVLGGFYLLAGRFTNLAPEAVANASANDGAVQLLIDERNDRLQWDNGPAYRHPVSAATPEWVTLTWPRPVALRGLATIWAGFNGASAQVFSGPDNVSPTSAPDQDWKTVGGQFSLHSQYPRPLSVDWLDFGATVETRAVRLNMTAVTDESRNPNMRGWTHNGSRIWLDELMAVSPIENAALQTAVLAPAQAGPHAPIPIRFNLDAPGSVTLAIDDSQGNRVRNLISDTHFEAGPNTAWWDGTDDLGRDRDAATHGLYVIPTHFVAPGHYQVHGLFHKDIDLHYEFSFYEPGQPPWETADKTGGWLTNHTPPSAALFVPANKAPGGKPLVYIGSYVSEGGAGLAWLDLDGKKQGGRGWIGGSWTDAPYLSRDEGMKADPDVYAYVASPTGDYNVAKPGPAKVNLRVTGLTAHGDKPILTYSFDPGSKVEIRPNGTMDWINQLRGLAVHDNLLVLSLGMQEEMLFADVRTGTTLSIVPVEKPRGVAFDNQGRLLLLSGQRVLRYSGLDKLVNLVNRVGNSLAPFDAKELPRPEVVADGLAEPWGLTVATNGDIYISDRGKLNQVRVYSESGKFLRAIGRAGPVAEGPYDALHMNNPKGLTIDSNNHLWVTEEDFQPKRVSEWTLDGQLIHAWYGPAEYGGGGSLDPLDKSLLFYRGMEFKLDWKTGRDTLAAVLYRDSTAPLPLPSFTGPGNVLYSNGHRYFTNAYIGHPTFGATVAVLYLESGGLVRPVAAVGKANEWSLLAGAEFKPYWPAGTDLSKKDAQNSVLFSWSDTNGDGQVEPDEVGFKKASTLFVTVMPDLSMTDSIVDGKAMRYAPVRSTPAGIPVYDLDKGTVIVDGAQTRAADGGGQMIYSPQATVLTTAPAPFAPESVGGVVDGHRWSYPSLWPGLHPGHVAPLPDHPGELQATTRLLGGFLSLPGQSGADGITLWGINGNFGSVYLFTVDGLFVTQLFQDSRVGKAWTMPTNERNMLMNDVSLGAENFFPSLTETSDGKFYLVGGTYTSIVRVDGLDTLRRLPSSALDVTSHELDQAQAFLKQAEVARQSVQGQQSLHVTIRAGAAPALTNLASSLSASDWAVVERRINQVGWSGVPDVTEAAITVAGGRLFAVYRSDDPHLLANSGAEVNAPFKTGGALDLMIGTDGRANPQRTAPVAGDERLLVYQLGNAVKAMLYRAVVPGTRDPILFSSPDRTITLDQVKDVSDQLQFTSGGGVYAFSIPLGVLGLSPVAGQSIKADVGVLRGDGTQTVQRVYWSNKATGLVSDVPGEAELTPNLWGDWVFSATP